MGDITQFSLAVLAAKPNGWAEDIHKLCGLLVSFPLTNNISSHAIGFRAPVFVIRIQKGCFAANYLCLKKWS